MYGDDTTNTGQPITQDASGLYTVTVEGSNFPWGLLLLGGLVAFFVWRSRK